MKNFTFTVPQDISFGMGSLKRLPELLKKNGSAKMLLVSDRGLEKLGVVEKVRSIVTASGSVGAEFLDVEPNPPGDTGKAAGKPNFPER